MEKYKNNTKRVLFIQNKVGEVIQKLYPNKIYALNIEELKKISSSISKHLRLKNLVKVESKSTPHKDVNTPLSTPSTTKLMYTKGKDSYAVHVLSIKNKVANILLDNGRIIKIDESKLASEPFDFSYSYAKKENDVKHAIVKNSTKPEVASEKIAVDKEVKKVETKVEVKEIEVEPKVEVKEEIKVEEVKEEIKKDNLDEISQTSSTKLSSKDKKIIDKFKNATIDNKVSLYQEASENILALYNKYYKSGVKQVEDKLKLANKEIDAAKSIVQENKPLILDEKLEVKEGENV